jgi:predicted restriction endonuclease
MKKLLKYKIFLFKNKIYIFIRMTQNMEFANLDEYLNNYIKTNENINKNDILKNYKKFGYSDKDDCKDDFIFLLQIKYNNDPVVLKLDRIDKDKFRKSLLKKYNNKCILSGDNGALEAAHIVPYSSSFNNDIDNGLLLRSDLHTLFDQYKWSIDPYTSCVVINSDVSNLDKYNGKKINLDDDTIDNIREHYETFLLKN